MLSTKPPVPAARGIVAAIEVDVSINHAIMRLLQAAGIRGRSSARAEDVPPTHRRIADCFILDVHLPGISGFELLRQHGASPPVVIITAHDDPMHRRAAAEAGVVAYLTKPFAREALMNAVNRALQPQG